MQFMIKFSVVLLVASLTVLAVASSLPVRAQLLPTFAMSYSPSTLSVMQGGSGTVLITVTSLGNWSDAVSLSFSDVPIGVSVSFSNNPITPPPGGAVDSTAYFSVDPSVPASTYSMTLTGSSGSDVRNYDFTLQVNAQPQPGDFGISVSPQAINVPQGGTGSATVTITSMNGFSSTVSLTSDAPQGVSVNFSPSQVTPSSGGSANAFVSVTVSSFVQAGSYAITLTGASSGGISAVIIQHSTQLNLQVSSSQDFTITVNPSSISIQQGESTAATVIITSVGGFSAPVGLSVSNGLPSGVGVTFSPNPTPPGSSTMGINVASSASLGKFSFQILGTSGSLSHTTTFTMTISQASQPSFSLSSSSSTLPISQGGGKAVTIYVSSINDFNSPVNIYATWVSQSPSGVAINGPGTLTPPSDGTTSGTLTLTASPAASVGNYLLSVVGSSGSLSVSTNLGVQLLTGAGDFSLSLSPSSVTLTQGSATTSTLNVQASGTFSSPVTLSGSTSEGLTMSFATNPVTPPLGGQGSTQVSITAIGSLNSGTYTIVITGVGGSLSHTATLTVTVKAAVTPDFTILAGPATIIVAQGSAGNSVIAVLSQNGFSSAVALSASWQGSAPSGLTFNLPSPITPQPNTAASSTLLVNAAAGSSIGTFTLVVTGNSGSLTHTATVTVQVSGSAVTTTTSISTTTAPPQPRCIIATATYGSELAPEVQFLRNFRDKQILQTFAGSNFMIAFNTWYYSFSPTVAQYITTHPTFRYAMKLVLYPMIGILRTGATAFNLFPAHQELAAVIAGLVISPLLGITYLALPMAAVFRFSTRLRRIARKMEIPLGAILASSLAGVALAELSTLTLPMILVSSAVVLSALVLSALLASRILLQITEIRRTRS